MERNDHLFHDHLRRLLHCICLIHIWLNILDFRFKLLLSKYLMPWEVAINHDQHLLSTLCVGLCRWPHLILTTGYMSLYCSYLLKEATRNLKRIEYLNKVSQWMWLNKGLCPDLYNFWTYAKSSTMSPHSLKKQQNILLSRGDGSK